MKLYKITKNGQDIFNSLTKEEAVNKFFPAIEERSNGYIYDNEKEAIFNEVDGRVVATSGNESVTAGNDHFQITEDNEC